MRPTTAADRQGATRERIAVATPLEPEVEDELSRVSWPRTIVRLALDPAQHPWRRGWALRRRAPLYLAVLAVLLLLLLAAAGCASPPTQSLFGRASTPPPPSGARCETIVVSQELQVPPEGELADLRLTVDNIPEVVGKLRALVRRPRFGSDLLLEADRPPEFDKVLEVNAQRQLTVVLARPRDAPEGWPRATCRACRVDVELTGLFGAHEALESFFARVMQEAASTESGFSQQSAEPAERPSAALREMADALAAEGARCAVPYEAALRPVLSALASLESARMRFYGAEKPDLPEAAAVQRAWESAAAAVEKVPLGVRAARAAGWPASLRPKGRLRWSAAHLDLASQVAALPPEDKPAAAQWIALALSSDRAALDRRIAALPRIRDLADAEARLDWVDPRGEVRLPGVSRLATLRVSEWRAAPHGRRCIGAVGAVPVRDPADDAAAVATMLGADARKGLHVARAQDIPSAREKLRRARELLCEPLGVDLADLFTGLEERELGPVTERLEIIFAEADPRRENDEVARAVSARTSELLCKLFDAETIQRRVTSVVGYKIFAEGGTHILEFLARPLMCGGRGVAVREIRKRLRDAWRAALDKHGAADRLCPVRSGKCPEEIAASVRRIFALQRPELAAPAAADSRALDFPPPFGFSDEWVQKLDHCAREGCEALARLRFDAPAGQFEGPLCAPRTEGAEQPQEVTLEKPESPSTVKLAGCEALAGVRLTLRRGPEAGTLVSIASSHQFRYGSENVTRQGRHPQLGRIYERVADLTDPGDVSRRPDGIFELALTPTVENQVFYFFSLRRRDY
jgi:hypothetical protein